MPEAPAIGAASSEAPSGSPSATASPDPSSSGTITPTGTTQTTDPKGPIPYERFDEVNTKYGSVKWAEGLDQDRTRQQQQFFQWLEQDSEGAFKYLQDYLTRNGRLRQQAAAADAQSDTNKRPEPDTVVPETGQRFYSADGAERLAQWVAAQSVSPLEQRLQTVESSHAHQRATAAAQSQLADARTWPYFEDHRPAVLQALEQDRRVSLEGAYRKVVLPQIRTLERDAVLKEINQKSQASTVNPGSQTASHHIPGQKLGFAEVFKREMAKRGGL